MYQVLYRKWRPKVFSDVVGQPHITSILTNELKAGRLAHAYLFTGSRGTGKTTCAKILAKAVNCLNPIDGNPCNECEICKGIDSGSILDVVEIDAASNNGVDNIRDLREETNFTPSKAKYRVYIIDEVHMLSIGAFNALLKTLEEPPEYVMFILATTEVHKLPATILSRCQRFDFRRIAPEDITGRLKYIAEEENISLTDDGAMLIARIADGGMRDALSLLDQCAGENKEVNAETVRKSAGLAGRDYLFAVSDAVINHDCKKVLEIIDSLHNSSCDMEQLCTELTEHFRNFMICKTMPSPSELIICTDDELNRIKNEASRFTLEQILFALDLLQKALESLRNGADRRIKMEMTLIKLCSPKLSESTEAILERISVLENMIKNGAVLSAAAPSAPAVQHVTETKAEPVIKATVQTPEASEPQDELLPWDVEPAPANNATVQEPVEREPVQVQTQPAASAPVPEAPAPKTETNVSIPASNGDSNFNMWPEVLAELSKTDKPLVGILNGSSAFIRDGNRLLIKSPNPVLSAFLKKDNHVAMINQAVIQVTGQKYRLGVYRAPDTGAAAPKKDPLADLIKKIDETDVPFSVK